MRQVLTDKVPAGHEFILRGAGARLSRSAFHVMAERHRLFNRPAHLIA
jgi:hypothetical protein